MKKMGKELNEMYLELNKDIKHLKDFSNLPEYKNMSLEHRLALTWMLFMNLVEEYISICPIYFNDQVSASNFLHNRQLQYALENTTSQLFSILQDKENLFNKFTVVFRKMVSYYYIQYYLFGIEYTELLDYFSLVSSEKELSKLKKSIRKIAQKKETELIKLIPVENKVNTLSLSGTIAISRDQFRLFSKLLNRHIRRFKVLPSIYSDVVREDFLSYRKIIEYQRLKVEACIALCKSLKIQAYDKPPYEFCYSRKELWGSLISEDISDEEAKYIIDCIDSDCSSDKLYDILYNGEESMFLQSIKDCNLYRPSSILKKIHEQRKLYKHIIASLGNVDAMGLSAIEDFTYAKELSLLTTKVPLTVESSGCDTQTISYTIDKYTTFSLLKTFFEYNYNKNEYDYFKEQSLRFISVLEYNPIAKTMFYNDFRKSSYFDEIIKEYVEYKDTLKESSEQTSNNGGQSNDLAGSETVNEHNKAIASESWLHKVEEIKNKKFFANSIEMKSIDLQALLNWISSDYIKMKSDKWDHFGLLYVLNRFGFISKTAKKNDLLKVLSILLDEEEKNEKFHCAIPMLRCTDIIDKEGKIKDDSLKLWLNYRESYILGETDRKEFSNKAARTAYLMIKNIIESKSFNPDNFFESQEVTQQRRNEVLQNRFAYNN